MSKYLKNLQEYENYLKTTKSSESLKIRSEVNQVSREIRDTISGQLLETVTITSDKFNDLKCKKLELEHNKTIGSFGLPQERGINYDLTEYDDGSDVYYPYLFGKTLAHNATTGFILKEDGDKLIEAIELNTLSALQAVPRATGANRKIEGFFCNQSIPNEGKMPFNITMNGFIEVDSESHIFEMMEVYAKQLARDIPFVTWSSDTTIGNLVTALNNYNSSAITAPMDNDAITRKLLFRGIGQDEQYGPYVSQFLYHSFRYGSQPVTQQFYEESNSNNGLSMSAWLNVQRGISVENTSTVNTAGSKYVYSPRMLGSIVHNDPFYQFFYNAAMVGLQKGVTATGLSLGSINSSPWVDAGPPVVSLMVAEVCLGALQVAWYQKYGLNLGIRPEVLAQRITLSYNNSTLRTNVPKLSTIKTQADKGIDILTGINAQNIANGGEDLGGQNYYLNTIFNEGSPTHPTLPAGHAVVAGAASTVLKSIFVTHDTAGNKLPWVAGSRTAVQANSDGSALVSYAESDASSMTIVGELNKLASNIALGRDMAGVHFRADGDMGILSGEEYAISFMQSKIKEFGSREAGLFGGFTLEKFDGTTVLITEDAVTNI